MLFYIPHPEPVLQLLVNQTECELCRFCATCLVAATRCETRSLGGGEFRSVNDTSGNEEVRKAERKPER